jgi:Na+/H+ antiporter NhaC
LLSFSNLPLRLSSLGGVVATFGAMVYLAVALVAKATEGSIPSGWTSTIFFVLMLGGAQLLMMGVMGEYLARTYQETKRRPPYVVRAAHGVERRRRDDG